MPEIETKIKIKIFVLGFLFTLLGVLMLWALLARVIYDLALNLLEGNNILLLIIIGLFGITFLVSVIVGIVITEDVAKKSVLKASGVALFVSFIILLGMSYFGLAIAYPSVYSEIKGFDIILAFPSVIMYFSIYVLNNIFAIYFIVIIIYYLLFLSFLETFYEYDIKYKHYESIFEQFERRRL